MTVRERRPPDGSGDARLARAAAPGPPVAEDAEALLARLEARLAAGGRGIACADAVALDALAVECARGGGAFELAIGEGLDLLARTRGDIRLGLSGVVDLARERLGISGWQARRLRRNAVALRSRPLLRAAVASGEVSARKAEVVLPVAVGPEEAYWVSRARTDTVRRLETAVQAAGEGGPGLDPEGDWHRIRVALPRNHAEVVDLALEVAKIVMGPTSPLWKRIWAIGAEFLSSFPIDPLEKLATHRAPVPPPGWEPAPAASRAHPVAGRGDAGEGDSGGTGHGMKPPPADPYEILFRLARLVADRAASDERLGRACLLVKALGVARHLRLSFEEWCVERLGVAPSTVYQRIALERAMARMPELREAVRSRRLGYEQARHVARRATPATVAVRIEEAAGKSCIALVREAETEARLQMCNTGDLSAVLPDEAREVLGDALRAARLYAGCPMTQGETLLLVALHFVFTWMDEALRLLDRTDRVVLRDRGLCQVPGCSRPAAHVHHIRFRSAGGPLVDWNELSLCAVHHLLGVHRGYVMITGRAPDGLAFVLGEREVRAARV